MFSRLLEIVGFRKNSCDIYPTKRGICVSAGDSCTCLFDGYEVKKTGKNCPNYSIKEEMHGQLYKNWGKNTGNCVILAKTVDVYLELLI